MLLSGLTTFGFRKGRSCLTYVGPHVGRDVVLRMDLQNFFPSIAAARIRSLFATLGYPETVARSMDADYTRYADDLAISGSGALRRQIGRVPLLVATIALEEGFEVNHRKTRVMHGSDRQLLTGIVVNDRPNLRRTEFDRLKAILTNCVRQGPETQNRHRAPDFRGHLAGRLAYLESLNPVRAARLDRIFRRIDWGSPPG